MRIIGKAAVDELFPMPDAIALMRHTFRAMGTDEVVQPLRTVLRARGQDAVLGSMPAYVTHPEPGFGLKAVTVNSGNAAKGLDTHLGVILVFDTATGQPAAVIEAGAVTAIRTAAASAVATDVLAARTARTLAIIGTGVQARTHLAAMVEVRPIERVWVWGRDPARAHAFAGWARSRFELDVRPANTADDAAAAAEVICTVTSSATPVLGGAGVKPGTHVNAVGSCFPGNRELATDLVAGSTMIVDSSTSALAEGGDLLIPIAEGALPKPDSFVELGQVLRGERPGRRSADEITIYESLGVAAQDVASARYICTRATRRNVGRVVDLS